MLNNIEENSIASKEIIIDENIKNKEIELDKNCITGDNDYFYNSLKKAIQKAKKVDIIVAFLMESGVRLLEEDLKLIGEKDIPIRILTGNYLNITQPSALYLVKDILGDKVDLRFYSDKSRSFHPKAYIFEYENGGDIFIGSSNISRSALTRGIEWNYRIRKAGHEEDFNYYKQVFEDLFLNKSIVVDEAELKRYSKTWVKPKLIRQDDKDKQEEENTENKVIQMYKPRGAQIEALYELKKSRGEGADKGLVVAATGIGKTYLAAFDSKDFKRVLFVAHREEILTQAEKSFKNVRENIKTGFFGSGKKDKDCECLFATVQTLGKEEYLNEEYFPRNYFEYIVVDEFHHAAAGNYQNIINYFKPKFLLGLTATPERLDNKDVFAICDYNLVYEVGLKGAINKEWLVPFRYYGIYDDTDYNNIEYKNGKYNEKQLEEALMISKRANLILNNYRKFCSKRALVFCSTKQHAEYMAKYFCEDGVEACAVYSGDLGSYAQDREEAVNKLVKNEIKVIFSVDMFNEGLDIPSIDMVMFLRPTQSPTIFLQQLGRGLRKHKDKKYLNVLDFIGNYKKANLVPFFLTGDPKIIKKRGTIGIMPKEENYPEDCTIDFQWQLIDIFKRQEQASQKIQDLILQDYYRVKETVKHRPLRLEMFTYIDDDLYDNIRRKSKLNIFKNYFKFLKENNELREEEKALFGTFGEDFINMIEKTSMAKTYKMPILFAFYNNGNMKLKINDDDVYKSFKEFYEKGSNGMDMLKTKNTANYKQWGKKEYVKLAKDNPIKFLAKTHGDFFYIEGEEFCLNERLGEFKDNDAFLENFRDAVEMRVREYYRNREEGINKK
ncbi:DEAD/DEAH box helicase family protein [Clostridium aestuarii]